MRRLVPVLEWLVLLPLWRGIFRPRPLQLAFAVGTALTWLLVVTLVALQSDGDDVDEVAGANAVTAAPGAVAEAEHVRVVLHEIVDPWTSDSPFQQSAPGRRLVAFDVTIDFFDNDGTHNANPFLFTLTDSADFAYSEALRGPEPMLQAVPLGSGQKTRGWVAFEVESGSPVKSLKYDPNRLTTKDIVFSFH